jgi:hypothetical protein
MYSSACSQTFARLTRKANGGRSRHNSTCRDCRSVVGQGEVACAGPRDGCDTNDRIGSGHAFGRRPGTRQPAAAPEPLRASQVGREVRRAHPRQGVRPSGRFPTIASGLILGKRRPWRPSHLGRRHIVEARGVEHQQLGRDGPYINRRRPADPWRAHEDGLQADVFVR